MYIEMRNKIISSTDNKYCYFSGLFIQGLSLRVYDILCIQLSCLQTLTVKFVLPWRKDNKSSFFIFDRDEHRWVVSLDLSLSKSIFVASQAVRGKSSSRDSQGTSYFYGNEEY